MTKAKIVGSLTVLLFGSIIGYGITSFNAGCKNGAPKILTERDAVEAGASILLARVTSMQLALAEDKVALASFIQDHPECCSAKREFSVIYWDYVWDVIFDLQGTIKDRPRREGAVLTITACNQYVELNWMSDH